MKIGRNVLIYTASSLLSGAVPLLLLPLLTRLLSESDYGAFATVSTLLAIATPIVGWGTCALSQVEFFKRPRDQFPVLFSSVVLLPPLSFLACLAAAAIIGTVFGERLNVPTSWMLSAVVLALLAILPLWLATLLRVRDEAIKYAWLEAATAIVTVLLTLIFVVWWRWDWQGRMYATAGCSIVMSLVALHWLRRNGYLVRAFDRASFQDALRFGAGLVPHDIGGQVIRMGDRLFLVALLGLASTGQYAVASSVGGIMLVIVAAFNRAWSPYVFSRLSENTKDGRVDVVKRSYQVIAAFFGLFVIFNVGAPLFYYIFVDPKFHDSMRFIPWLTLGHFFAAVYTTYVDYIFYLKKTYYLSMITTINVICNAALNLLLIPHFGAMGAAYAFAGSMLVVMCLAFLVSYRLYPMPWLFWLRKSA
jgi:O-antigen/teichoic acid export membrane protein